MNTRRCELCGALYGTRGGSVSVSVPKPEVDCYSNDHYNLCQACSLKVYNIVEELKTSDGNAPENKPLLDLIQRQNAELEKLRYCLRRSSSSLYSALKHTDSTEQTIRRMATGIEEALGFLDRVDQYDMEE